MLYWVLSLKKEREYKVEVVEERKRGFARAQRSWIKRAYEAVLGTSACVFPVWNGEEYVYCGEKKVEIHHIKPRGWCIRVLNIDPNVPQNGAPLCAEHHRLGQRDKPLTRKEQDVIHLDAAWANRNYSGTDHPTSYGRAFEQRFGLCSKGVPYWYELWDQYLAELAEDIIATYALRNPDDKWPSRGPTS